MSTVEPADGSAAPLRRTAAGDAKPAWITLLTTEHYNLQTQRASTISETNGRASVFLGSVSSGLVALGFASQDARGSAAFAVFAIAVLSALVFLGIVTFARTVQTSIDDVLYATRIDALRSSYAQLVPELAAMLAVVHGGDVYQQRVGRRSRVQKLLTVAGSISVITSLLTGADIGLFVVSVSGSLITGLGIGVVTGAISVGAHLAYQSWEWRLALAHPTAPPD